MSSSYTEVERGDGDRREVTSTLRDTDPYHYVIGVQSLESDAKQTVYVYTENVHGRSERSYKIEVHTRGMYEGIDSYWCCEAQATAIMTTPYIPDYV